MNENETDRIAAMANALRPDWPVASLRALLRRPTLANKTRRDMAVALAWVACESETKTPARVAEAGPWWNATAVDSDGAARYQPPKADQACGKHPGEWRERCRSCAADRLAPVEEDDGEVTSREQAIALARAQLTARKAAAMSITDECMSSAREGLE